jgi:hypothetical protein
VIPHTEEERAYIIEGLRVNKPSVIEPEAYPEIVHQQRKTGHDSDDTPWPAEFVPEKKYEKGS